MASDDQPIVRLPVLQDAPSSLRGLPDAVRGEVRLGVLDRGLYAADASPYDVTPIAVVSPRDSDDLQALVGWCGSEGVPLIPRGAGTSLAGQTVGEAVIVDCSTHLHRILEIDPAGMVARVEPGVVLDDLRRAVEPLGLSVGPDVSTSTHATIGGMIGNASAGARSLVYGMTDEHVVEIDGVLADGTRLRFGPVDPESGSDDPATRLARGLASIVRPLADEIQARFPVVPRNVGGFRLDDVLQRLEGGDGRVDLGRFLAGTEGTLAVTAEATIRLVRAPGAKVLLVVGFETVSAACDRVADLVATGPVAVELMDAFIIEAAAAQPVFARDVGLLPTVEGRRPGAVLMIEFHAGDLDEARRRAEGAMREVGLDGGVCHLVTDPEAQARTWAIRTTGLGLISKPDGDRIPMAGLEDCGVPLERLAEFQRAFDALIRSHGWSGVFYAHASVGLLHVRPRIDLGSASDRAGFQRLRMQTLDLVLEHGGSISGEHGDGRIRGDLVSRMYGPRIVEALVAVKNLFDPAGILNPGNKVTARDPLENLRADHERHQVDPGPLHFRWDDGGPLEMARACNGNGLCRRHEGGAMCPSYRALLDETHSTRGRANALRLALGGRLSEDGERPEWGRTDVSEALAPCLSCKACRHECPSNVDLGKLKAEHQAQARGDRSPSFRERILGRAGLHVRRAASTRGIARWLGSVPGVALVAAKLLDLDPTRPLPLPAARRPAAPRGRFAEPDAPVVALLDDCFTRGLEPGIIEDATRVLDAFGWRVRRLSLRGCCGRPQISSGMLSEARGLVERSAPALRDDLEAVGASALVVLEPSCLSALHEEWRELVSDVPVEVTDRIASAAMSLESFLEGSWADHPRKPEFRFADGLVVHPHCHAKIERSRMASLFGRLGAVDAEVLDSGCCGLAGSFGYRRENATLTRTIFRQSLGDRLETTPPGALAAAGTSCRHQCADLGGIKAHHPATILATSLILESDQ